MIEPRLRGILLFSLGFNFLFSFLLLFRRPTNHPLKQSLWPDHPEKGACWDLDGKDNYVDPNKMALPSHHPPASEHNIKKARLTNVVMPFHSKQEPAVLRNLELWNHFVPCSLDGYSGEAGKNDANVDSFFAKDEHPGGKLGQNISFTFFVSSEPNPELEIRLLAAFEGLAPHIRGCFKDVNVKFSSLTDNDDKYLTGSRKMFEFMLNGWLGMKDPYHVLYMEPDCLPIRPNWLTILDSITRYPNAPFWIKGSIFRGNARAITNRIVYNLFHVNGNALYNLGDPGFRHFYFDLVRPYIAKYYNEGAYDTDIFKYLLDLGNYNSARQMAHLFQFTDAIQNHWHSNYSISELKAMSEMVVLVHGGTPSP